MNIILSIGLWAIYLILLYFAIFWLLVFLDVPAPEKNKQTKKLKEYPFVTIAVPAYNEEKTIQPTIQSLVDLEYPKDRYEILVMNDGSTDRTKELAEEIIANNPHNDIKLINRKIGGQGKAVVVNMALERAKGEYFVCFDADSIIEPHALKKLLPLFTEPDIACVLPMLKVYKPKKLLEKIQWYEYIINMYYKRLMSHLDCVHVAPGPFSVYKTAILKKVGGFSTKTITEDMEISLRLQKLNYRLIQSFDAQVWTVPPDNMKDIYKQRNRWYKGAIYNAIDYKKMMFNKKYGDFGFIQLPFIIIPGAAAIFLLATHGIQLMKDVVKFMFNISSINFDVFTLISGFKFSFSPLDMNFVTIVIAMFMMILVTIILVSSHKHTNERVFKQGFLPLALYVGTFHLILSFMWVGIAIDMLRGKMQKW